MSPKTCQPRGWLVAAVMARRELIRFARQPARVAAAIGTPCVLWVFMAGGFAEALRPNLGLAPGDEPTLHLSDVGYAAFLLPGIMTLVVVFGAIFSSLSVIEDRNEGWLHAALVSPAPRWSIAVGRIAGGAIVAWGQAALLLALAPLLGIRLTIPSVVLVLAGLAVTSVAMTAIGLAFAWRTETSGGFHAVMNLVLMPMWMLSGSLFPMTGAAGWLAWVMWLNPLTYGVAAVRGCLTLPAEQLSPGLAILARYLGVVAVFALLTFAASVLMVSRRERP